MYSKPGSAPWVSHRPLFIKFSLLTTKQIISPATSTKEKRAVAVLFLGRRASRIGVVLVLNGQMSWHDFTDFFRIILISNRGYRSRLPLSLKIVFCKQKLDHTSTTNFRTADWKLKVPFSSFNILCIVKNKHTSAFSRAASKLAVWNIEKQYVLVQYSKVAKCTYYIL